MKRLTEWLERAAIATNIKRVNWWLQFLLALMIIGFVVAVVFGNFLARHR